MVENSENLSDIYYNENQTKMSFIDSIIKSPKIKSISNNILGQYQKFNKTNSYNLFSPINNKKYDKKNEFEENKVRNNIYFNNSMNEDSTVVLFSNNKNNNIDKSKKKLYLNTLAESPEINLKDELINN